MIEQALRAVGLRPEDTLGRYPHQLSGGQRQRTMVARTLLLRPQVDRRRRAGLDGRRLAAGDGARQSTAAQTEFGISLIYITHDLTTAYQISDRIIVLHRGGVVEAGRSRPDRQSIPSTHIRNC